MIKTLVPNIIYGGLDGIITTFSIVMGSVGSGLSPQVALILGLSNVVADGFSMGVASYESVIEPTFKHQEIYKGFTTFLAFVILGMIPLLSLVYLMYRKPKNINFNHTNIRNIITLTLVSFLIVGILKSHFKDTDKNKKQKIKTVILTLISGSFAGLISYLIGHYLKNIILN